MVSAEASELNELLPSLQQNASLQGEVEACIKSHGLSPQEFFYKWEAFALAMGGDVVLDQNTFSMLRRELQDALERSTRREANKTIPANKSMASPTVKVDNLDAVLGMSPATPGAKKRRPVSSVIRSYETPAPSKRVHSLGTAELTSSPSGMETSPSASSGSTPFSQRKNPGQIMEQINPELDISDAQSGQPVEILANFQIKKYNYKTMYQRLLDVSEVLDEQIDAYAEEIARHHGLTDDEIGNPAQASQEPSVVVGRICVDSDSGGRPTATSLLIETSRRLGSGARRLLNISQLTSCAFYPGQLVAFRGNNPDGSCFVVQSLLDLPPLGPATSVAQDIEVKNGLDVIIANGPYTTNDNLLYEALDVIVERVIKEKPSLVILGGPFIDEIHPLVESGEITNVVDFGSGSSGFHASDVFRQLITPRINKIVDSTVLLMNCTREWGDTHGVFPQAALDRKGLGLNSNIKALPNPAVFTVNDTVFGMGTNDILSHLSKEEYINQPRKTNIHERLVSHVINSRSFYPLFPGPVTESGTGRKPGARLDVAMLGLAQFGNCLPDVLILPSEVYHFVKVVDNVISVNPGAAAKPRGAGTYVRMYIKPPRSEQRASDDEMTGIPHAKYEHSRIDLVRL